jgi:hypothetical protein
VSGDTRVARMVVIWVVRQHVAGAAGGGVVRGVGGVVAALGAGMTCHVPIVRWRHQERGACNAHMATVLFPCTLVAV